MNQKREGSDSSAAVETSTAGGVDAEREIAAFDAANLRERFEREPGEDDWR